MGAAAGVMGKQEAVYRHSGLVRVTHWVNALVLLVLLMSGLQIFNAHPALYLGSKSDFAHPVLMMMALQNDASVKGVTKVLGYSFDTTGVLGLSVAASGRIWATSGTPEFEPESKKGPATSADPFP